VEERRTRRAVLSLRVWLAEPSVTDRKVRIAYMRWQVGSGRTGVGAFDRRDRGGLTELKQEASDENAGCEGRWAH
jgi:hypothetical protein